jgi:hypothetical protein
MRNSWRPAKILDCLSHVGAHHPEVVLIRDLSGIDEVKENPDYHLADRDGELFGDLSS